MDKHRKDISGAIGVLIERHDCEGGMKKGNEEIKAKIGQVLKVFKEEVTVRANKNGSQNVSRLLSGQVSFTEELA